MMSLARTRRVVAVFGAVVLAAVVAGLVAVGGPDAGRRDRRDAARLDDLRRVGEAVACHAEAGATPPRPVALAEISPACLAPDTVAGLADPRTGRRPYAISYPAPDRATVCADFEAAIPDDRAAGWPPFDRDTGCVSVTLGRD
jgi:hypothetical protein